MQQSVTSLTALLPETKDQQKSFVQRMIDSVLEGYANPLEIKARFANMKSVIDAYSKDERICEAELNEANKYQKEELTKIYNASFVIKEVGMTYDYSGCNHPIYNELIESIKELEQARKDIENFLQTIRKETKWIDPTTGEEVTLMPPCKKSTTKVTVTINK